MSTHSAFSGGEAATPGVEIIRTFLQYPWPNIFASGLDRHQFNASFYNPFMWL